MRCDVSRRRQVLRQEPAEAGGGAPIRFTLYSTLSTDGRLTWAKPTAIQTDTEFHLCEPGAIRSPDGKQVAVMLRDDRSINHRSIKRNTDDADQSRDDEDPNKTERDSFRSSSSRL